MTSDSGVADPDARNAGQANLFSNTPGSAVDAAISTNPDGQHTRSAQGSGYQPLAARLRPHTLGDYAGQEHILGPGKPLRQAIDSGQLHSMIFWGPPGVERWRDDGMPNSSGI